MRSKKLAKLITNVPVNNRTDYFNSMKFGKVPPKRTPPRKTPPQEMTKLPPRKSPFKKKILKNSGRVYCCYAVER